MRVCDVTLAKAFFRDVFIKNSDGTEHIGQVTGSRLDTHMH